VNEKIEFISESKKITSETDCLVISKELHNKIQDALIDALNYRTPERFIKENIGNISQIGLETDKGFGRKLQIRIRHDGDE